MLETQGRLINAVPPWFDLLICH